MRTNPFYMCMFVHSISSSQWPGHGLFKGGSDLGGQVELNVKGLTTSRLSEQSRGWNAIHGLFKAPG
jgi:hypothetical protein